MNTSIVVWQLSRELAIATGLASENEHSFPYTDAITGFSRRAAEAVDVLWKAHCYVPVALKMFQQEVMTADGLAQHLEFMFEHTNHIQEPWSQQAAARYRLILPSGTNHRSTSVGDVMQVNDNLARKLYRVASFGFEPMTDWSR